MDLSRREFTLLGVSTLSGSNLQINQVDDPTQLNDFRGVAFLFGPESALPASDDAFWDNKISGLYLYETYEGTRYWATVENKSWNPVNWTNNIFVTSSDDLPAPTNGTHTLENKVYWFVGFVTSPYGLDISNSPILLGRHAGYDGFIHTGQNTAITGSGGNYLQDSLYIHAPGGTLYDISGDQSTEMLVTDSAFSDAAGIAPISNMGTIDGFRVPTWKNSNIEDISAGFTFTGSPDKIYFEGCPLRTVVGSNVTILQFDSDLTVDIVDMPNNYVKGVQSDTQVINVASGATINEIFQYRGNTHDQTVVESNILTGEAGVDTVGFRVTDSFPLPNTKAFIDYTLDDPTTVTINTQAASKTDEGAYERVSGTTTERGAGKFNHANNLATYVGRRDRIAELQSVISAGTGNSDVVALAWFQNGSLVPGTETRLIMNQQGGGIAKPMIASGISQDMETNDDFDVRVANLDSTTDIDIGELTAKITT